MRNLPSGTVTLLFSDIEGSTGLLLRLGELYSAALAGQRTVLRAAWSRWQGVELGTEGDSFFVAFPSAADAVAAAVQGQRDLAARDWPGGEQVRVRMGLHAGTPQVRDDGYVGIDVHRAARIAASAHGGQVVVSHAVAALVGDHPLDGVTLLDLGQHQLKDIPLPEHLFQLCVQGLPGAFPALRTVGAASTLPVPATPLVGRQHELAELTDLVASPGTRLLTLTGPGGTGKTRLATEVAAAVVGSFPDGVFFVPLAEAGTAELMWTTIAEVLDLPPDGTVPPGLFPYVAHRAALFCLDNLEQVDGADAVVDELLAVATRAVVVVTSRRPLHISGEHEYAVPPLGLPAADGPAEPAATGAVQMFVQHARMVRSGFALTADNTADVVAVCRRLDGLPLAIELAAARTKLLSPHALLARLDRALDLPGLGGKRPSRQQTLRQAIGWSYDLLAPGRQRFFARLGAFSSGADLAAVQAVAADPGSGDDAFDVVAELVDASLVAIADGADGEPRVRLLETVRSFALDRLVAAGTLDEVRRAHATHFLAVVTAQPPLGNRQMHVQVRAAVEREIDNLRAALDWSLRPDGAEPDPDQVAVGMALASALWGYWEVAGTLAEGRRWLERAVGLGGGGDDLDLAGCRLGLASVLRAQGQDLLRISGLAGGAAGTFERHGDVQRHVDALIAAAMGDRALDDLESAQHRYHQALEAARRAGDEWAVAYVLGQLGDHAAYRGDLDTSLDLLQRSVDLYDQLGDPWQALNRRHNLACTLREMGRVDDAYATMRQLLTALLGWQAPNFTVEFAEDFGAVLAELGRAGHAALLLGAADAGRERNGYPRPVYQEREIEGAMAQARQRLGEPGWQQQHHRGTMLTVEAALAAVDTDLAAPPP